VKKGTVEWAVAESARLGQNKSGDRYLVKVDRDQALSAVVDGLGHGEVAAEAAERAITTLEENHEESLITLVRKCHEALRRTRGVVMSLAKFDGRDHTVTWLGVGNVEGYILHHEPRLFPVQESLLLRAGIVGDYLPRLSAFIVQASPGDMLIFATDGIRPGFADQINLAESSRQIADRILALHGRSDDDALVLVVRYLYGRGSKTDF